MELTHLEKLYTLPFRSASSQLMMLLLSLTILLFISLYFFPKIFSMKINAMSGTNIFFLVALVEVLFRSGATTSNSMRPTTNQTFERTRRELLGTKYLAFPDGSNIQLVYCLTISTYTKPSGMYTIGVTAGMAWELPHRNTVSRMDSTEVYHRRSRRELYRKVELMLSTFSEGLPDVDSRTKYDKAYLEFENCSEMETRCPDIF